MTDVREKSGSASSEDFRNAGGTPLVIDTAGKVAYAMDAAGSIFSLPANSSLTAINVSAGTTSNNLSKVTFSNANGVTFGLNASVITASVNAGGSPNFSAGTTSNNLGSVVFSNSHGISFGLDGSTITASYNPPSGRSIQFSAGTTSESLSAVAFNDANGVSFGLNAGTITATVATNYLTTAALSNHSHGNPQLNLTNLSGTTASNSAGFTLSLSAGNYLTTAMASNASTAFAGIGETTTTQAGTALGLTVDTAGVNIAYPAWLTTARASNDGVGLNTALTAGPLAWTVNSGGISLNAGSAAGTTSGFTGANISMSMTHNTAGLAVSASVAAPGGGAAQTVSYYANARQFVNSQTMTFLQSTSHMVPFVVDQNVSFAWIRIMGSGSVLAASSTAATTGNTSYTAGHFRSHNLVIYSRGIGASSASLQYVTSTQFAEAFRMTQSHAANSTQHSYTLNYTFPCSSGNSGVTKNYSSSAASLNYHTSQLTNLTGLKAMEIPFAGSLSPGRYWLAYGISSTTSTQRTADQSRQGVAFTAFGMSQNTLAFGVLGAATNSSVMPFEAGGSFTTAGGSTTASVEMTRVSSSASHNQLFFQLMRVT